MRITQGTDTVVSRCRKPAVVGAIITLEQLPSEIAEWVTVDPDSGCWRYARRHDRDGYGRIGSEGAHRVVWRLLKDEIPAGRVLDHVKARGCRWNDCINPAHLEPVTHRVNVLRGNSFAARNFAKNRCIHGHPYDLLGTYWRPNGHRDCRVCIRDRVKRYRRRRRARLAQVVIPDRLAA